MRRMTSALRAVSLSVLLMTCPHVGTGVLAAKDGISRTDAAVMAAARADDLDTLKQLAEAGLDLASVEHDGTNLATIAAMRGSPDTLAFLAAQGVDFESGMPGFGDQLSDQEIWNILGYIKSTWPEEIQDMQAARTNGVPVN